MGNLDTIITLVGIVYGLLLITVAFVSNRVTESIRIDALFMSKPSESTRLLNLVAGIFAAGYGIYSLLKG